MPDLPLTALKLVAKWLFPDDLLTLARVNSNWYTAFTSGEAWQSWDVYELGQGVCSHYLSHSKSGKEEFARDNWYQEPYYDRNYANRYGLLARARARVLDEEDAEDLKSSPQMIRALARTWGKLPPIPFSDMPTLVHPDDCELVYSLLRVGLYPYGLHDSFARDKKAALLWVLYTGPASQSFLRVFDEAWLLQDREFVLAAVQAHSAFYFSLPQKLQDDLQIFDLQFANTLPGKLKANMSFQCDVLRGWIPSRECCKDLNRMRKLMTFTGDVNTYIKACICHGLEPDMDLVAERTGPIPSANKVFTLEFSTLPRNLQNVDFVVRTLQKYTFPIDWSSLPADIELQPDVLELAALRCADLDPNCAPGLHPWLQRLFVLAKSGMDISSEMTTLQDILRLPSYLDLKLPTIPLGAQDAELEEYHYKLESIAARLYAVVGESYLAGSGLRPSDFKS